MRDLNTNAPVLQDNQRLLPIISLVAAAAEPCFSPAWPRYTQDDLSKLSTQTKEQVGIVLERLVEQYFESNNFFIRWGAKFFLSSKKNDIVDFVRKKVEGDLTAMELMTKD